MNEPAIHEDQEPPMHHREITLEDGRYMIFYTFSDESLDTSEIQSDQGEDV